MNFEFRLWSSHDEYAHVPKSETLSILDKGHSTCTKSLQGVPAFSTPCLIACSLSWKASCCLLVPLMDISILTPSSICRSCLLILIEPGNGWRKSGLHRLPQAKHVQSVPASVNLWRWVKDPPYPRHLLGMLTNYLYLEPNLPVNGHLA